MGVLGWRSLRKPSPDDPLYWQKSTIWWNNWAHDLIFCLVAGTLMGAVAAFILALVLS